MGAAFEVVLVKTGLAENGPCDTHMSLLAAVRGTGERHLLIIEAIFIRSAGLDQRQSLEGLDGRAREYRRVDIAYRG
jgi:hypothetical protein